MTIPLPVIAGVFRCTLNWNNSTAGQTAANVMHFDGGSITETAVATAIDAHVTRTMWALTTANAQVNSVDVLALDGVSSTITFPVSGTKWQGESTGDFTPALACVVKETTGVRGRDNRGRVYLPFISETDASQGVFDADDITEMNTAWAAFLAAMITATVFPVVASYDRRHGGAGAHATHVNLYTVETVGATQRRRQSRLR